MCGVLATLLQAVRDAHLPASFVSQCMSQVAYFMDCALFNTLLTTKELVKMGCVLTLKMNISAVEEWLSKSEDTRVCREQFTRCRQTADMIMMPKEALIDNETRHDVASALSASQIHHLLSLYSTDEYDPVPVPRSVLVSIDKQLQDEAGKVYGRGTAAGAVPASPTTLGSVGSSAALDAKARLQSVLTALHRAAHLPPVSLELEMGVVFKSSVAAFEGGTGTYEASCRELEPPMRLKGRSGLAFLFEDVS